MKLMTSWKLEGLEEGRLEGAQRLALRQLRRRTGGVSELQEAQIRRLPLEHLDDLADALLDFTQPSDLDEWLQGNLSIARSETEQ